MKIADLKQPYRRMAEYLAHRNTNEDFPDEEILIDAFDWSGTDEDFWNDIHFGEYPPITDEIKKHFPDDFDFSGEEQPLQLPNNPIIQNRIYTQLAKEGKFNQLPDTCEFSEPVLLEVWDNELSNPIITYVLGKFKGRYVTEANLSWQYAKLPQQEIDLSKFNLGDVVEVETESYGVFFGMIHSLNERGLVLTFGKQSGTLRMITDVKSIKKIK